MPIFFARSRANCPVARAGGRRPAQELGLSHLFAFAKPAKATVLDHAGVAGRSDLGLGSAVSRAVFGAQTGNLG
jgi:hypothetical protein